MTDRYVFNPETNLPVLSYKFTDQETNIFIAGAPLSGKSSFAPLLAACIQGAIPQNYDIFRGILIADDDQLPPSQQDKFLRLGSCDAFSALDDGRYTPGRLIEGYRQHAKAMCKPLGVLFSSMSIQGSCNVIFEGVQLSAENVSPFMRPEDVYMVLTASDKQFLDRISKRYGNDIDLRTRYSADRLSLVQDEIVAQAHNYFSGQELVIDGEDSVVGSVMKAVAQLKNMKYVANVNVS